MAGSNYLAVEDIIEINDSIYERSLENPRIEYSGRDDFPTSKEKLVKLVEMVPRDDIISRAVHYLKNLILLQAFPNGNHRTAFLAVQAFLRLNGYRLAFSLEEIVRFYKHSYTVQFSVYGTYEALSTDILGKDEDEFGNYC